MLKLSLHYSYYLLDCFVPYNNEFINPRIINRSGLLRSARNDGDLYRHHSFLQGIYHVPGTRNDDDTYRLCEARSNPDIYNL